MAWQDMRLFAYDVVYRTLEENGHSDELFHRILRNDPEMERNQKGFVKRLSFGTIERAIEMDACLEQVSDMPVRKMDAEVRTVLRMALYEIRHMQSVAPFVSCDEAVKLIRHLLGNRATGFVNGVLREYLRREDGISLDKRQELSLPEELFSHLVSQYGKKTAGKIGKRFLEKSGEVTLHLDTNKILKKDYINLLETGGVSWRDGAYFADAVMVSRISDVQKLPGYEKGWFFVQDESSMLPVACAGIRPGDTVADICCAPGGKSMHALMKLNGSGSLVARDVSLKKVDLTKENLTRMGYGNVSCEVWDAAVPDAALKGRVDILLADVPCSGIGIIGRKPEIKYRAMAQAGELVSLQRAICEASVPLLKPGGVLIYSTCTINRAENEENVKWLLQRFGLVPESLDDFLPEGLQNRMSAQGMLQILPGIQECDGFFVARLRKKAM